MTRVHCHQRPALVSVVACIKQMYVFVDRRILIALPQRADAGWSAEDFMRRKVWFARSFARLR